MDVPETPVVRLQQLLRELLQLDLADLDFGLYRLLRLKQDEIEAFLQDQLPAAVDRAFATAGESEREELEERIQVLARRIRAEIAEDALHEDGSVAEAYGEMKIKLLTEYAELREQLRAARVSDERRIEVFNHLYAFFKRYYEDGDFVPKRRYGSRERYAVPYNGEETLLHWANQGQHYVKSAEVFRDYAFTVEGDLLADPARVRFILTEATVAPGDAKGDTRYFFPRPAAVEWDFDTRTLRIPFTYRLPTKEEAGRLGRTRIQETILDEALPDLKASLPDGALRAALVPEDSDEQSSGDAEAGPGPLLRHLRRFVRRQTSDHFVHRNLRGFLERELAFYIKDQVLQLADLDGDLRARQRMLKVLREVAGEVITFLAQIEEVQKRLFEKRKFVLRTDYLVLMEAVPEELRDEVLENDAQTAEWERLFRIDPRKDLFNPEGEVNEAFLERHPTLVVNTALFDESFRDRLLASFDDIEEATGGILVHSENYQALRLLEPRFRGQVKCIYIDPPYNTGSDDFLYKDRYQHSSWLTMMEERLRLGREMLSDDGAIFVSIDENEQFRLQYLLRQCFGEQNYLGDVVWKNANDNNPTKIAIEHEYILAYARHEESLPREWKSSHSLAKQLLLRKYEELVDEGLPIDEVRSRYQDFLKVQRKAIGKLSRYKHIDEGGPFTGSESVHNPHPGGYDYELKHPVTGKPMRKPANGYRFPESTMREDYLEEGRLIFGPDENRIVKIKLYLSEFREAFRSVIRIDSRLGAYALKDLFGSDDRRFRNPKAVELISHVVSFASDHGDYVLDFTAGSGTVGQAVIDLNRSIGTQRRFILVDQAEHFFSVLQPRIAKSVFASDWKKGEPDVWDDEHGSGLAFPLIKILRLESYEDALHNLSTPESLEREERRARAIRRARGDEEYRLRYLARLPMEASATLLDVEKLAHPFRYELEVLTDEGPERRGVDLVETFNLVYGLRVRRMERWENEADAGRHYRVVFGEDPDGASTVVIWRGMEDLDPEEEKSFLEERLSEAEGHPFDTVLINGDSVVPGVRSLDPVFKARMEEPER